jgi:hypothetical protein
MGHPSSFFCGERARRNFFFRRVTRQRLAALLLSIGAVLLCPSQRAQTKNEPWVQKDWTQWSSADCQLVLNNSPWVLDEDSTLPRPFARSNAWADIKTVVRIASALPIRQARLRELQLKSHYDGMSIQNKLQFDEKHDRDFPGSDGESVVIEVTQTLGRIPPNGVPDQIIMGDLVPSEIALRRSDGKFVLPVRVELLEKELFIVKCQYIFPRAENGALLYKSDDPSLRIDVGGFLIFGPNIRTLVYNTFHTTGEHYSFEINDLVYKGKPEY